MSIKLTFIALKLIEVNEFAYKNKIGKNKFSVVYVNNFN